MPLQLKFGFGRQRTRTVLGVAAVATGLLAGSPLPEMSPTNARESVGQHSSDLHARSAHNGWRRPMPNPGRLALSVHTIPLSRPQNSHSFEAYAPELS